MLVHMFDNRHLSSPWVETVTVDLEVVGSDDDHESLGEKVLVRSLSNVDRRRSPSRDPIVGTVRDRSSRS